MRSYIEFYMSLVDFGPEASRLLQITAGEKGLNRADRAGPSEDAGLALPGETLEADDPPSAHLPGLGGPLGVLGGASLLLTRKNQFGSSRCSSPARCQCVDHIVTLYKARAGTSPVSDFSQVKDAAFQWLGWPRRWS